MRRRGKGDAIPLIAFHNAPLFKAGFFTLSYQNQDRGTSEVSFNYGDFSAIIKGYFGISGPGVPGKRMK